MPRTVLSFLLLLAISSTASAQTITRVRSTPDRSFDIGIGLAINGFNDVNGRPLCTELGYPCNEVSRLPDPGVVLSWAGNFGEVLALVVEGGVYKERWDAPQGYRPAAGPQTNTVLSLGLGPRVFFPGFSERTRVFGQVLWGARMSNAVEGSNAIQPGAGLEFRPSSFVRLRLQFDYAITRGTAGPRTIGGTRVLAGVALPIRR